MSLDKKIRINLHSHDAHCKASVVYNNPDMFSEIRRAWTVCELAHISFSRILDGLFDYEQANAREVFSEELAIRLQLTQIESADALRTFKSRDPPCFNSDCGHYDGYTLADFEALLKVFSKVQRAFLLSSYPSPLLSDYAAKNDWKQEQIEMDVTVAAKSGKREVKTEVLTRNY